MNSELSQNIVTITSTIGQLWLILIYIIIIYVIGLLIYVTFPMLNMKGDFILADVTETKLENSLISNKKTNVSFTYVHNGKQCNCSLNLMVPANNLTKIPIIIDKTGKVNLYFPPKMIINMILLLILFGGAFIYLTYKFVFYNKYLTTAFAAYKVVELGIDINKKIE
jgi:hypothetical protein